MKTYAAVLICVVLAWAIRFGPLASFDLAIADGPGLHRALGLHGLMFWILLGLAASLLTLKLLHPR